MFVQRFGDRDEQQHVLRTIGRLTQNQQQHAGFTDRLGDLSGVGTTACTSRGVIQQPIFSTSSAARTAWATGLKERLVLGAAKLWESSIQKKREILL
jgi:hypothetical protein